MASPLSALVYYNGRKYNSQSGITFEAPDPILVAIRRSMSLDALKSKIHHKLRLQRNQVVSNLTYRCPLGIDMSKYMAVNLRDGDDIDCMIDMFERFPQGVMEIYADIENEEIEEMEGTIHQDNQTGAGPSNLDTSLHVSSQAMMGFELPTQQSHAGYEVPEMNNDLCEDVMQDSSEEDLNMRENDDGGDTDLDDTFDGETNLAGFVPPIVASPVQIASPILIADPVQMSGPVYHQPPCPQFSEINWEALENPDDFAGVQQPMWSAQDELFVGLQFSTKDALTLALKQYSLTRHQTYKVVDSDSTRLVVRCPQYGDDCHWRVRAIYSRKSQMWKITKFDGPHTCVNAALTQDHNKLDSVLICSCVVGMVKQKPDVPVSLIQERVQGQYDYFVSYRKA